MRLAGVRVAQWLDHVVELVEKLQMAHAAFVNFLDAIEMTFDEMGTFHGLNDSWLIAIMSCLQILEVRARRMCPFSSCASDGVEPVEEIGSRVTGLFIACEIQNETGANRGESRLLELVREEKLWPLSFVRRARRRGALWRAVLWTSLRMRLGARRIDVIVHVDADRFGENLCDAGTNVLSLRERLPLDWTGTNLSRRQAPLFSGSFGEKESSGFLSR